MNATATFAQDIAEMMNNWNALVAKIKKALPASSEEEVYQLAKAAMNNSLGL